MVRVRVLLLFQLTMWRPLLGTPSRINLMIVMLLLERDVLLFGKFVCGIQTKVEIETPLTYLDSIGFPLR